MKMEFVRNAHAQNKQSLNEFEYSKLDADGTQDFIRSIAVLFDRVFETQNNDFEEFVRVEELLAENDPQELFERFFAAIQIEEGTKYQKQFLQFAKVNIATVFKWYRKNHGRVNLSPKQVEWFKRRFAKHDVGHEFLNELDPNYTRSITPNFNKLFDTTTPEGEV
tara:strand:- start:1085 stop:1579 length:495 start_codon:yes stop_codon:yes gene_type:complete